MNNCNKVRLAMALSTAVIAAAPVGAQTLVFSGTRENVNPLNPPGGRCVPPYFLTVNIAPGALSSTGTSNISNFESTQSHCITSPPPTSVVEGQFTYTFEAGDTIFGTYTGNVATGATPGSFSATENLIITGGTGRFVGATGTIDSNGILRFAAGNGIFQGTLAGEITATTTTASGEFATALGVPSAATGDYSTALGAFSYAPGDRATAVGAFSEAIGLSSTAVGDNSFASGSGSIAVGLGSRSTGVNSIAIGTGAVATGSVAVGAGASASNGGAAFGDLAAANGSFSTAVGPESTASALSSSAFGYQAIASGIASTALGHNSDATALASTAVGVSAQATQTGSTALGRLANAAHAGATAVGGGSATTAANQVVLGGTGSHVRVGDIAASTTAQQSTSVGVATVDANGVLGRDTLLLPTISSLQSDSSELFDLSHRNRRDIRDANDGVAMALALDSPNIPAGASVAVSGGVGYFKNRAALATAISVAVGEMSSVSAGVGYGFSSKEIGARAGFQFAW